jgi:nitroreductase
MDAIFKRRSILEYIEKEVNEEQIAAILHAGMSAPSAGNEQPWHFLVIKNRQKLQELMGLSPYAKMLDKASVAILVCGDLEKQKHEGYWMIDCAAATENMLLEVTHLQLGAVWLGVYPRVERMKFLRDYFSLPNHIEAFSLISIGYPTKEYDSINRYNPERVHWEKW